MLYKRIFNLPTTSFFLLGPRGTGKTTFLKEIDWASTWISLLDQRRYQSLLREPGLLYDELVRLPKGAKVVIDEIQKIPGLLNEVHRLIEDRKLRFALTGSSARKLRKQGVNLLGGRAVQRLMFPLTPMEMGEDFNADKVLQTGSLPLVISSENPRETLEAYVHLYLKEEIQSESLVKNLSGFSRFLPIAALVHGQVLNISNIARDAEVERTTVQTYFDILEDTLLCKKLPAFSSKLRVREKKRPKFYFLDPGIARACRHQFGSLAPEERGPLFEGLIFMLLEFQKECFRDIDSLHYWSPSEAKLTEVDFILKRGKELTAIEAKSGSNVRPEDLKGLKAIGDLSAVKRRILVYLGPSSRTNADGIEILKFSDFVKELVANRI